jgi:hypothetical protein
MDMWVSKTRRCQKVALEDFPVVHGNYECNGLTGTQSSSSLLVRSPLPHITSTRTTLHRHHYLQGQLTFRLTWERMTQSRQLA